MIASISPLTAVFLYFWGIKHFDELISEGVNVGEFWGGLGMESDLGFGCLLFRGTWQLGLLSLRSSLGPCRGYSVRRYLPVFPYITYSQWEGSAVRILVKIF